MPAQVLALESRRRRLARAAAGSGELPLPAAGYHRAWIEPPVWLRPSPQSDGLDIVVGQAATCASKVVSRRLSSLRHRAHAFFEDGSTQPLQAEASPLRETLQQESTPRPAQT